jgi:hypothetical protein
MSCDAVASVAFLWLAATSPIPTAATPQMAPPAAVASEPLFVDIVQRAGALKAQVEAFKGKADPLPEAFKTGIGELSALDMKGHLMLAARGTDGDLKCILKGISQDLPLKLAAVQAAATPKDRDLALRDMAYLLNDNVEVITAPPAPPV